MADVMAVVQQQVRGREVDAERQREHAPELQREVAQPHADDGDDLRAHGRPRAINGVAALAQRTPSEARARCRAGEGRVSAAGARTALHGAATGVRLRGSCTQRKLCCPYPHPYPYPDAAGAAAGVRAWKTGVMTVVQM